jgi:hypothetical protein
MIDDTGNNIQFQVDNSNTSIPNRDTFQAIIESRNHLKLKEYKNVNDFFNDLNKD